MHFLRFELSGGTAQALKDGAGLALGIDHGNYGAELSTVAADVRASLAQDLV